LLREPQIAQFNTGKLRLPILAWQILLRLSWLTGHHSQREYRDEFRQRVLNVAERLSASTQDMLVVSHAGMMAYLGMELRRRGFAGPKLRVAEHGIIYTYVRD
jgi:broad specificity phosphatase PhoE